MGRKFLNPLGPFKGSWKPPGPGPVGPLNNQKPQKSRNPGLPQGTFPFREVALNRKLARKPGLNLKVK